MKVFYILFLVLISAAELLFVLLYYFLTFRFDLVPTASLFIYLLCLIIVTLNYRMERYRAEKEQLLEGLFSD